MSLALCVGVAFLLLAGSAFAQTAGITGVAAGNQVTYATQAARVNQVYTLPTTGTVGYITRQMGVARAVADPGAFLIRVTLPAGLVFNAAQNAAAPPVSLSVAGGSAGFGCGAAAWDGGTTTAPFNAYITYKCSFAATAPSTAPTVQINPAGWTLKDAAGNVLDVAGDLAAVTVQTFDAVSGFEFDNGAGSVPSATWLKAANGMTVAITPTKAVIDVATARKNFLAGVAGGIGTDVALVDNDAAVVVTYPAGVYGANGNGYVIPVTATDLLTLTLSSATADCERGGIANFVWDSNVAAPSVALSAGQRACTAAVVMSVPGNNAALAAITNAALPPAGATGTIPVQLVVNGTDSLTTRSINVQVGYTYGAPAVVGPVQLPSTLLTSWAYNGTVLLANFANANTAAWKSRFYIFNETTVANAIVFARVFTIPGISSTTAGAQVGNQVQFTTTLGAISGAAIRLEDIINAANSGMNSTNLAGDGSFNVAVEITVLAPSASGFVTSGITGVTQTMNLTNTMSFGSTPMQKIQ